MSIVCRECGWMGTPGPGEDRCPACRTPFPRAAAGPAPASPAGPRPPQAAPSPDVGGAGSRHATPAPPRSRRTGSFLLGMGIAGLAAVAAARVYAPGVVTFATTALSAGEPGAPQAGPASAPPASPASPVAPVTPVSAAPAPAEPPEELVEREMPAYLPDGYTAAGTPARAGAASAEGVYEYRVPLQAQRTLYRVRVVPAELPPGAPALLRENRGALVLHPALPPGRTYAVDAARPASRSGEQVEGTWRVRWSRQGDAWRVAQAWPVVVDGRAGDDGSALLAEAALAQARAAQREALERYTARARAVERDVESLRAAALREVPPRCGRDVSALLGEVVRLAADCPSLQGAERSACYERRDRANGELGACERQNQLHDERSAAARRAAAVRGTERRVGFARELAREAEAHRQRTGG
jgi:hypothetical protein